MNTDNGSDISILLELIKEDMTDTGMRSVLLEELGPSSKITQLPNDTIVIKMDRYPYKSIAQSMFKCAHGECKRSDYVIINESRKCIVYIELKSGRGSTEIKHIAKQLKGAECFIEYCKVIASSFWGKTILGGYNSHYVVIYGGAITRSVARRARKQASDKSDSSPDKPLRIANNGYIPFWQLVTSV